MISDAFSCFAVLCGELAPELAEKYRVLHEAMNEAVNRNFFDEEQGTYRTRIGDPKGRRHALTQAWALFSGAVPKEQKLTVLENMIQKEMISCSLCNYIYLFEELLKYGEKYRGYVRGEIERIWGNMLLSGATSFWETERGASDFGNAGSLCHGWSATPVYIYRKYKLLEY